MLSLLSLLLIILGILALYTFIVKKANQQKRDFEAKLTGGEGEQIILNELAKLSDIGKPFNNLYITFNNGSTTEIDVLFVTFKGVYLIESKNYSGKVVCNNIEDTNWQVVYGNGKSYRLYNPLLQNKTHINGLKHAIGLSDNSIIPLVVFGRNADIESIRHNGIIKVDELVNFIINDYKTRDTIFTQSDIEYLLNSMKSLQNANMFKRYSHIRQVKQKQRR